MLQALVDCDYDWSRLEILAIDDRSQDRTGGIIDEFAARYPIIKPIHRTKGTGGKGAALRYATPQATGEILLLFDADYIPSRTMIKFLVAPFCDPEIGAVMGRVVPENGGASVLAGLLELERGAGYQIGQQARYNLENTRSQIPTLCTGSEKAMNRIAVLLGEQPDGAPELLYAARELLGWGRLPGCRRQRHEARVQAVLARELCEQGFVAVGGRPLGGPGVVDESAVDARQVHLGEQLPRLGEVLRPGYTRPADPAVTVEE